MISVLKIGGNELDDPAFIAGVAQAVKQMRSLPIIVHGGGKSIKMLARKFGIDAQYLDGRRVIDTPTLEIIMMVLCGQLNVRLVAALIHAGIDAQGFNGADRGLIRGTPVVRSNGSLGRVGEITSVRADVLQDTLKAGIVPVIAPVLLGEDSGLLNINADAAAASIGATLRADQVVFLTNVAGVLNNNILVEHLTSAEVAEFIASRIVTGGMAVKLNAALDALNAGVEQVMITDLSGLKQDIGTIISV